MSCVRGVILATSLAVGAAGCSSSAPAPAPKVAPARTAGGHHDHDHDHGDDHDHDHGAHASHPSHDTLKGALEELKRVCSDARAELSAKNLDKADGHVHMVGHLVEDMHTLLDSARMADEPEAAAKKALEEVFDCFDALDSAIHSSDEKVRSAIDYLEHEPKISAAIESLEKIIESQEKPHESEAGHAHEADE